MPLTQLEHYLVLTDDLDGTRDFYRDALGLREGPRPPLGFPGYWLYLGDVPCLHIGVSTPAPGPGPLDHIACNAMDLAGVKARLSAHGVAYSINEVPNAGLTQLFLLD